MYTPNRLPVSDKPETQPKRHLSAHYYAHRVRGSLTTRVSKIICAVFLSLLLVFGTIVFILWLSLRPHRPRFHIHEFTVPNLSQPTGLENDQIRFSVTVRNANQQIGIHYDSMVGTVYYKDQSIGSTTLTDAFYQEPKTTTIVNGTLGSATLTVNNRRWAEFLNERQQGTVVFRLEVTSVIRFKVSTWNSKHHKLHVNCDVDVGQDGSILPASRERRCPVYFT